MEPNDSKEWLKMYNRPGHYTFYPLLSFDVIQYKNKQRIYEQHSPKWLLNELHYDLYGWILHYLQGEIPMSQLLGIYTRKYHPLLPNIRTKHPNICLKY